MLELAVVIKETGQTYTLLLPHETIQKVLSVLLDTPLPLKALWPGTISKIGVDTDAL